MPTRTSSPKKVKTEHSNPVEIARRDWREDARVFVCDLEDARPAWPRRYRVAGRFRPHADHRIFHQLGRSLREYVEAMLALGVIAVMPRLCALGAVFIERHWHLRAAVEAFADLNFLRISPGHAHHAMPIRGTA